MRERIAILGLGKAGGSLLASAVDARLSIVAKASRFRGSGRRKGLTSTTAWLAAHTLFLAVPDDVIEHEARVIATTTAARLPPLIVHMSGAKGASALDVLRARAQHDVDVGTFHPLASLDGHAAIPRGTFVAIDASSPAATKKLTAIAKQMGLVPGRVKESDRVRYHAGAVVAGNLATALLHEGVQLLVRSGVQRDVARVSLARLLASTAANAIAHDLDVALTGPIARGDVATLERHLTLLDREDKALAALYRTLSRTLIDEVSAHSPAKRKKLRASLGR